MGIVSLATEYRLLPIGIMRRILFFGCLVGLSGGS
jgi:hypothetical protein